MTVLLHIVEHKNLELLWYLLCGRVHYLLHSPMTDYLALYPGFFSGGNRVWHTLFAHDNYEKQLLTVEHHY